jgi:hypothetical protein
LATLVADSVGESKNHSREAVFSGVSPEAVQKIPNGNSERFNPALAVVNKTWFDPGFADSA